ncbi:hypothetical protein ACEWY4_010892 [Coilia grayii]|uniref:Complex 1 LYR protein domain-containing protein n=1 Tax=Coilia grayii TaxID=363190 RepID=A0ABD1K362_9TELE
MGLGPTRRLTVHWPRCDDDHQGVALSLCLKMANPLRGEVVQLYKNLLYLGKEYPKGADYFRDRLRAAFTKNKNVQDPEKIKELISRGEFVIKELEALYYLRKYRAMKKRYYEHEE